MSLFRSSYSWIEFGAHSAVLYVRKQSPYFPGQIVRRATQKAFNAIGKRDAPVDRSYSILYTCMQSSDLEFFLSLPAESLSL